MHGILKVVLEGKPLPQCSNFEQAVNAAADSASAVTDSIQHGLALDGSAGPAGDAKRTASRMSSDSHCSGDGTKTVNQSVLFANTDNSEGSEVGGGERWVRSLHIIKPTARMFRFECHSVLGLEGPDVAAMMPSSLCC